MLSSTFPRALLPLTTVYRSWLAFRPSLAVYLVLFPLLGGSFGIGLFALPLLLALQMTMNVGIALLVSTFVVLVRDASNLMNYVTRLLFFTTPVIYPIAILPDAIRPLLEWQPLFPLFASYQAVLGGGMPDGGLVARVVVWTAVLLAGGVYVFLKNERGFALRL
jgi:ABC-type polysaccharide/polyol phosphate export permease